MTAIDPNTLSPTRAYLLQLGCIVPRPIAFVSTVSADGVRNLAPFSYFTGVASRPATLCFSIGRRQPEKDTYLNIVATGEFVVNVVTRTTAEAAVATSAEFAPDVDEFAACGFSPVASDLVAPPRVAASPVAMECRLRQIVEVAEGDRGAHLILGDIVRYQVDDALWHDGRLDVNSLDPVGRLAGRSYCTTRERFEIDRPPKP
jgi:flavin reductase (DIM6/NTAB) family NADH-FMN oxidoreductase RutF